MWEVSNGTGQSDFVIGGRVSDGLWGWMRAGGAGELCEVSTRMKSEEYIDILQDVMIPSETIAYPD